MDVAPGEYEIEVLPAGTCCTALGWRSVRIAPGSSVTFPLDSGIDLAAITDGVVPVNDWEISDVVSRRQLLYTKRPTLRFALPPGDYLVQMNADSVSPQGFQVSVTAERYTQVDVGMHGIGEVEIELPAARGAHLASGHTGASVWLARRSRSFGVRVDPVSEQDSVFVWLPEGEIEAELRGLNSPVHLDYPEPVTVVAGSSTRLAFEPDRMMPDRWTRMTAARPGGQRTAHLVIFDLSDDRLLAVLPNPAERMVWFAPKGSTAWVSDGGTRRPILAEPAPPSTPEPGVGSATPVDSPKLEIEVESPRANEQVQGTTATVVGRVHLPPTPAKRHGLQVVLVVDTSGSVRFSSGKDINGDGEKDSVLAAEVAAGRLLLRGLVERQAADPAASISVGIVAFSDEATEVAPVTQLKEPGALARLEGELDEILSGTPRGGTGYAQGLDRALATLGDASGTTDAIVFLTDGSPGDAVPALSAAAVAGHRDVGLHLVGLGDDFDTREPEIIRFPPPPSEGLSMLMTMATVGGSGSTAQAAPVPADVLSIIPTLPILRPTALQVESVAVHNETTNQAGSVLELRPDGGFVARVPVSLTPLGPHTINRIAVTAAAGEGLVAREFVEIRGRPRRSGQLHVSTEGLLPARGSPLRLEIVLDASGSMRERMPDGRTKMEVAKSVLLDVVRDLLPEHTDVALRVYGHRVREGTPGDCEDSELLVPFGRLDRTRFAAAVDSITALGTTPLAFSLRAAAADLEGVEGRKTILVVTDGKEECAPAASPTATELMRRGIDLRVDVVGFSLADEDTRRDMEALASATGGRFFDVRDEAAFRESVSRSLAFPVQIRTRQGELLETAETGRDIVLPEGQYTVVVGREDPAQFQTTIVPDETTVLVFDAATGELERSDQ